MTCTVRQLALVPVLGLTLSVLVVPSGAGPDKVKYPAAWKDHVLYTTVDRYDIKQYRELYASSQAAVDAMKAGRPLPDGTVLTLAQYKAQVDGAGTPVKDPKGRFVKGDLIALTVMEKRAGFGTEYPPELRNGDWEYAAFNPAGVLNEKANYKGCFECHKPHEKQDFVISLAALRGRPAPPPPPSLTSPSPPSSSGRTRWQARSANRSPGSTMTIRPTRSPSSVPRSARRS